MRKFLSLILIALVLSSCATTINTEKPQTFSFITATRSPEPGTFAFDIPIVLKLDSIKSQLMQNFQVSGIKINDVKVYGANTSELVIGLNIDANKGWFLKVKGWIYLRGTPDLDVETQMFRIKNVHLDANTEQAIVNGAAWILNPIINAVASGVKIDIQKIVENQKTRFQTIVMEGYGTVKLDLNEFVIREIDITDSELEVRVKAAGIISTTIDLK